MAYARSHRDYDRRARWPPRRGGCASAWPRRAAAPQGGRGAARQAASRAIGLWLDLVRVPPSGTWERRRADLYGDRRGVARAAAGRGDATRPAIELLVRRYLGGFGPSHAQGGRRLRRPAAQGGRARARPHGAARASGPRTAPSWSTSRALPLADPDTPAPVRFLPAWDATLLVHARRTRILPEEHRPRVFSHPRRRSRSTRSWSTARWRARGGTRTARSRSSRSRGWTARPRGRCARRPSGWPRSAPRSPPFVMIFAWGGRSDGIPRAAMSPAASGGRTVEPVTEEDF